MKRIPALDGVRALSIGLVIVAPPLPMSRTERLLGETGVRAFFVISGYLITTLLLRERAARGRISLRAFYALAASYAMNFVARRSFYVGHAWSLAVEEQFYLPRVAARARRARSAPRGVGRARRHRDRIGVADRGGTLLARARSAHRPGVSVRVRCARHGLRARDRRADLERSPRYTALLDSRWFWYAPALCLAGLLVRTWRFELGAAQTLANAGIALAIHRCVARPETLATRVLELPVIAWIGALSYSLYLWQEPFFEHGVSPSWCPFPASLAFAFAAAAASHYLVEKPALRAGRRMLGLA